LSSQKPVIRHFPDVDSDAGQVEKVFLGILDCVAVVILVDPAGDINSNVLDSVEAEVSSINIRFFAGRIFILLGFLKDS